MPHPSDELIQNARQQLERRGVLPEAASRYESLAQQFRGESEFDSFGFHQALLEIESPGGIVPPAPPTLRGRVGHWAIRIQSKIFWWLIRALRLEGQALRAAYATVRYEHERVSQLEQACASEIASMQLRLERIERQLGVSGEKFRR